MCVCVYVCIHTHTYYKITGSHDRGERTIYICIQIHTHTYTYTPGRSEGTIDAEPSTAESTVQIETLLKDQGQRSATWSSDKSVGADAAHMMQMDENHGTLYFVFK
jgi:hypothetical protein